MTGTPCSRAYRTHARIVVAMHTESPSYDAMVRRYNKSDRGLPNELREMHVGKLPQQACRELLAERMFKAHKTLSVRQTDTLLCVCVPVTSRGAAASPTYVFSPVCTPWWRRTSCAWRHCWRA